MPPKPGTRAASVDGLAPQKMESPFLRKALGMSVRAQPLGCWLEHVDCLAPRCTSVVLIYSASAHSVVVEESLWLVRSRICLGGCLLCIAI